MDPDRLLPAPTDSICGGVGMGKRASEGKRGDGVYSLALLAYLKGLSKRASYECFLNYHPTDPTVVPMGHPPSLKTRESRCHGYPQGLQALLRQSFFRLTWRQSLPISIQASLPLRDQVREQPQRAETQVSASCQGRALWRIPE